MKKARSTLCGMQDSNYLKWVLCLLVTFCLLFSGNVILSNISVRDRVRLENNAKIDYLQAQLMERDLQYKHLSNTNDEQGQLRGNDRQRRRVRNKSNSPFLGFNRKDSTFNGTAFYKAMSEADGTLMRELVFRHNTRYWLESRALWPDKPIPPQKKYVTFSPWHGGFNNIRMSLEMAVAFAAATGRTLVMPPEQDLYMRGKSSLASYFDYDDLARAISVVTYEEFFEQTDFGRFQKEKPGTLHSTVERYYEGLKNMPEGEVYNTADAWGKDTIGGQVVFCFPNCPPKSALNSNHNSAEYKERKWFEAYSEKLQTYDADMDALVHAKIVHFPKNLLGHFYTMIYHRDVEAGRRIKRIVRDHVHFREEIFEMAERIINKLQDFEFSCLHIRRNDFQFEDAWTSAEQIVQNTNRLFKFGEIIYVSTDELSDDEEKKHSWNDPKAMVTKAKHTWFEPFKKAWGKDNVLFLSDFFDELLGPETPSIYIGCIESVICSRARVFVGTRKSTFSGYIHRMRGYMHDVGQKVILDAQSNYPSDYFKYFKGPEWNRIQNMYDATHPYWGREYKDAWEGVFASPNAA